jgi:preprotein translocase subunit SecD
LTNLGALKGFAITSIIGEAVAFFVTRPAYLKILPKLIEK